MFTNKKELEELKESISAQIASFASTINQRLQDHDNSFDHIKDQISEIKDRNNVITEKIRTDLTEIGRIKTNFTTALNRVEAISRNIETSIPMNVREVAEKEIESIKNSSRQFKEVETDLKEVLERVNDLQLELSKFISISQQINLVDFSLKKHQEDLNNYESENIKLRDENEDLKSILAKMKRNRR